jgi:uncharacterized membrane protein YtjA (UPF0391 family)
VPSAASYARLAGWPLPCAALRSETAFTASAAPSSAGADQESPMLHYAIVFLVIALIAAVFGFGGIAASAVGIAKVLFFVFVILAVLSFVFGLIRKP